VTDLDWTEASTGPQHTICLRHVICNQTSVQLIAYYSCVRYVAYSEFHTSSWTEKLTNSVIHWCAVQNFTSALKRLQAGAWGFIQHNDVKKLFQCRLRTRPTQRCHSYDSAAKNDVIETDRAVSVSRSLGEGGAIHQI